MRFTILALNFVQVEVRVDLCCGNRFVPQELLHGPKVCAALEEVDRIRVPERVRPDGLLDTGSFRQFLKSQVHGLSPQRQATIRNDEERTGSTHQSWPGVA